MISGVFMFAAPAVVFVAAFRVTRGMRWHLAMLWVLLGVYSLWAADLLFAPIAFDPRVIASQSWLRENISAWTNVVPCRTIAQLLARSSPDQAVRQIGGNLGLLLPLGLFGPVLVPRLRPMRGLLLAASLVSVGIETLQFVGSLAGVIGRSVDIDDVILNVIGALLGWAVWKAASTVVAAWRGSRG